MRSGSGKAGGVGWPPPGWVAATFQHEGHDHDYYVVGGDARPAPPSVLLLHEFPGLGSTITAFADRLARNFRVVVPSIFGDDGHPSSLRSLKQICVSREVHILARHGVSASVRWLRDFVDAHVTAGGEPYAVVGMCFSGNFALALAVDRRVGAAVVAQPALPLWPSALGLTAEDRATIAGRRDLCVRGYRFERDCMSPKAKLDAVESLFGDDRVTVFPGLTDGGPHSTLTGPEPSRFAVDDVEAFLRERLASRESSG